MSQLYRPNLLPVLFHCLILLGLRGAFAADSPQVVPSAILEPSHGPIVGMCFVAGEQRLVVAHADGKLSWWNSDGKEAEESWHVGEGGVSSLAISDDGRLLFVARTTPHIDVIERSSRKVLITLQPYAPVTSMLVSTDASLLCAHSTHRQIFHVEMGNVATMGLAAAEKVSVGLLKENLTLLCYWPETGWMSGSRITYPIPEKGPLGVDIDMFQVAPDRTRIYDASLSADRKVALVAAEGGLLIPVCRFKERIREFTSIPDWNGAFRVIASRDGSFAICLENGSQQKAARGLIWDMVNDRHVADLSGLPKIPGLLAFSPSDNLLAVANPEGAISLWNLAATIKSESPPTAFLNGRVSFFALSDRVSDPAAPFRHKDWYVERWSNPQAPGYLKDNVWSLSPNRESLDLYLDNDVEGSLYYVFPDRMGQSAEGRIRDVTHRAFMTTKCGWADMGRCPWRPDAQLYRAWRGKKAHGMLGLPRSQKDAEIYFVPGANVIGRQFEHEMTPSIQFDWTARKVARWLQEEQFQEIENLAVSYQKSREVFQWGQPSLGAVYHGLRRPSKETVEVYEARLKKYLAEQPDSVVAHVVYAQHWVHLGWQSRGHDVGVNVPPTAYQKFQDCLAEAVELLEKVAESAEQDPYFDLELLRTMTATGGQPEEIGKRVITGLRKNPANRELISSGAMLLQERWSRDPAAASRLADQLRREFPGDTGRALAALLAIEMFEQEPERWVDDLAFSYSDFEKDLPSLQRFLADSPEINYPAARLAVLYGDRKRAIERWHALGSRVDSYGTTELSAFAEWTDRIEDTPCPGLVWSVISPEGGALTVSADGEHLITLGTTGRMRLFEVSNGELLAQRRGVVLGPLGMAVISPEHAVVAGPTGILHYRNDDPPEFFRYPRRIVSAFSSLSQDGSRLVIVDQDGALLFLDTADARIIAEIPDTVTAAVGWADPIAISADSQRAAVAISEDSVQIFNIANGSVVATLSVPDGGVHSLRFHSGSAKLGALNLHRAWEWDVATQAETWSIKLPIPSPLNLEISEDGTHWAVQAAHHLFTADAAIYVLHRDRRPEKWLSVPEIRSYSSMAWHPLRPWLAVSSSSGIISLWDTEKLP